MDDQFELPDARTHSQGDPNTEDPADSSDDEDGGLDWTNLPTGSSSLLRPVIPKRGEKEHEPALGGQTRLQSHVLGRAREAMFSALRVERGSSSKSMTYATWYPSISRAHVPIPLGIHFASLGHSVARPSAGANYPSITDLSQPKRTEQKRLELLPEEALYLIERGTLACSLAYDEASLSVAGPIQPPMSVQQAYASMIGTADLTLEKYQVFAYLKRLGYVVTRAEPPTPAYPGFERQAKPATSTVTQTGWLEKIFLFLSFPFTSMARLMHSSHIDWWKPVSLQGLKPTSSSSLFQAIRRIASPAGHAVPLIQDTSSNSKSPYKVFYNLYKPVTPYKKTAPAEPDFEVVVIDAQKTPMPTLAEFDHLFAGLPELPPMQPRKRPVVPEKNKNKTGLTQESQGLATQNASATESLVDHSIFARVRQLFGFSSTPATAVPDQPQRPPWRPNPFAVLKQGKKIIVIAIVDSGSVGFFRFGQGCFEEFPMA